MSLFQGNARIWGGAILMAAACSAASVWQLAASRNAHLHAAEQLALSLSSAAAQRMAVSLRGMDVLLAETAEKVRDPSRLDAMQQATLRAKLDVFPELDSMGLVDARGWLRHVIHRDSQPRPLPVDVSDAPHVRAVANSWPERSVFLSPPVPERFTGRMVVLLSRPLIGPHGDFLGSAGLAAGVEFVTDALASVVPGEGDAAGAFTPDGILYARYPRDDRFIGRSIRDSSLYRAYAAIGGPGSNRRASSFSDGIERIVGFTPVPNYPVIAAVGIDRSKVLERWRQEVWVHGGIQTLFVGVIFALARRLSRSELRRRALTEQMLAAERAHVESLERSVAERTAELNESLAALGESEERFRRIVEISPLPLVLTRRRDNRVMYINTRAAEAFGVPQDKAENETAPDYWVDQQERAHLVATLAAEGWVRNHEAQLKRANGEHFTALLSGATISLRGEDLVLIAVLDISERKRLEEDYARSNRDLEQFSYAVSHDLQEPLRMVASYLGLLQRRYSDKLDAEADEFIGYAVDGATRMSRMITALLDYSRVHRRGTPFGPVNLNDALNEARSNLSTAIADCGAQILAEPLPTVTGDHSQLMRVFQNLIGNAIKYRRPNEAPHIAISAGQQNGFWVVSVTDDGIGIDPAATGRLFQVFQRLHPRGAYEGTGVGLALCRRILERHGGRIWVDSAGEGQGCAFRFALPLIPPAADPATP